MKQVLLTDNSIDKNDFVYIGEADTKEFDKGFLSDSIV